MVQKAKNSNFTAVIRDEDYVEALTDYQWSNRLTRPELVRTAIDEFAANHGIKVPAVETPAESDEPGVTADEATDAPAEAPARGRR
jgi:hypothetical protein